MIANPLARKVLQVEYVLLRTPLSLLERRLGAQSAVADSKLRSTLERSVSTLDKAAARLLGDGGSAPASAPAAPRETAPAAAPAPAEQTTTDPAPEEQSAPEPVSEAGPGQVDGSVPAPEDEVERVAEELLTELDEAPLVGELADADEDERQRMADLRAKHLVEEYEEQQRAKRAADSQDS